MNPEMNIRLLTIFTSFILAISNVDAIAQFTEPREACLETPPGVDQDIADCLNQECKKYQIAVSKCATDLCKQQARSQYLDDYAGCFVQKTNNQHEWATIWYADGKYGVAFDLWDVPVHAVRYGF
jgi:hypothetical protein